MSASKGDVIAAIKKCLTPDNANAVIDALQAFNDYRTEIMSEIEKIQYVIELYERGSLKR